jgi:rubredoxin
MCPECESFNIRIEPYDFGTCPETGYRDAGERFECRDCGAAGDVSEIGSAGDSQLISATTS